jgi:DNA transformation protein and related proteins
MIYEKIRLLKQGAEMMKNMGPKSSEWLASVGIHTLDDVAKLGVVETYKRVKAAYTDKVSLDLPWNELPPDIKEELRKQVEES